MNISDFLELRASCDNWADFVGKHLVSRDVKEDFSIVNTKKFKLTITIRGDIPPEKRVKRNA